MIEANLLRSYGSPIAEAKTVDEQIMDAMSMFYDDPLGHVLFSYPWEDDEDIRVVPLLEPWRSRYESEYGPDGWACEFFEKLGEDIRARDFDGKNKVLADS